MLECVDPRKQRLPPTRVYILDTGSAEWLWLQLPGGGIGEASVAMLAQAIWVVWAVTGYGEVSLFSFGVVLSVARFRLGERTIFGGLWENFKAFGVLCFFRFQAVAQNGSCAGAR